MAEIARAGGFTVTTLLTQSATRQRVMAQIGKAARELKAGDLFLLTYSGHGGQLPDRNGDEVDMVDETWCLYNGELVDDELYDLFGRFMPGTRIAMFSDSCHSGTVAKDADDQPGQASETADTQYRFLPPEVAQQTYRLNRSLYDPILNNKDLKGAQDRVMASVVLISGCLDEQSSADGQFNGLFTAQLLRVWNGGEFKGGYRAFHDAIVQHMPPNQTPNYYRVGVSDPAFDELRPFFVQ